ncbi:MAG: hypothetical protein QOJ29_3674 [Thermoleophilaceae bacterium]|jgi:hypothetical protein|nr:hypothetical protein [Thermoleophilaceae bacterium]
MTARIVAQRSVPTGEMGAGTIGPDIACQGCGRKGRLLHGVKPMLCSLCYFARRPAPLQKETRDGDDE